MKDIGLELKGKREENGLSVQEVADDLKVKFSDIDSLESGIRDDFKDISFLKALIQDYAKYLGLDGEKLTDEFNEYLFDQTSRISFSDIEKAREIKKENEKEKIVSPYTIEKKEKNKVPLYIALFIIVLLAVFFISYFVVSKIVSSDQIDNGDISYVIGG